MKRLGVSKITKKPKNSFLTNLTKSLFFAISRTVFKAPSFVKNPRNESNKNGQNDDDDVADAAETTKKSHLKDERQIKVKMMQGKFLHLQNMRFMLPLSPAPFGVPLTWNRFLSIVTVQQLAYFQP